VCWGSVVAFRFCGAQNEEKAFVTELDNRRMDSEFLIE